MSSAVDEDFEDLFTTPERNERVDHEEEIRRRWEQDPMRTVAELRAELKLEPNERLVVDISRAWWRDVGGTDDSGDLDERLSLDWTTEREQRRRRCNDVGARWDEGASMPAPLYPVPFHMDLSSVCDECGRWECRARKRVPRPFGFPALQEPSHSWLQQLVSVGGTGMRNMFTFTCAEGGR